MDLLLTLLNKTWMLFTQTSYVITFQGETYRITLLAILVFSTVFLIGLKVLFSFFD